MGRWLGYGYTATQLHGYTAITLGPIEKQSFNPRADALFSPHPIGELFTYLRRVSILARRVNALSVSLFSPFFRSYLRSRVHAFSLSAACCSVFLHRFRNAMGMYRLSRMRITLVAPRDASPCLAPMALNKYWLLRFVYVASATTKRLTGVGVGEARRGSRQLVCILYVYVHSLSIGSVAFDFSKSQTSRVGRPSNRACFFLLFLFGFTEQCSRECSVKLFEDSLLAKYSFGSRLIRRIRSRIKIIFQVLDLLATKKIKSTDNKSKINTTLFVCKVTCQVFSRRVENAWSV